MLKFVPITPYFAVSGALQPGDFAEVARLGFRSVLSNLPDGESASHPASGQEAELAADAGLGFAHVPATKFEVFSGRVVGGVTAALETLEGPVLAHCASGLRSALAWAAAAAARGQPADCILDRLRAAGFSLDAVRDDLAALAGPAGDGPIPAALDAGCDKPGRMIA